MAYETLIWEHYSNLKTYSLEVVACLKKLIKLDGKEDLNSTENAEKESLRNKMLRALTSEANLLNQLMNRPDSASVFKDFLEKAKDESSLDYLVKLRLLNRLTDASDNTKSTNITTAELEIFKGASTQEKQLFASQWSNKVISLREIITTHLNISLVSSLIPVMIAPRFLGGEIIELTEDTAAELNKQLSDIILRAISFTSYFELLYALYGFHPDTKPLSKIEDNLTANEQLKQQIQNKFREFIQQLNIELTKYRNSTGEITFKEEPQEIANLLTILGLLELLIPCMTDSFIGSFKFQLEWGVNIHGDKHTAVSLIHHLDEEIKKREMNPTLHR